VASLSRIAFMPPHVSRLILKSEKYLKGTLAIYKSPLGHLDGLEFGLLACCPSPA